MHCVCLGTQVVVCILFCMFLNAFPISWGLRMQAWLPPLSEASPASSFTMLTIQWLSKALCTSVRTGSCEWVLPSALWPFSHLAEAPELEAWSWFWSTLLLQSLVIIFLHNRKTHLTDTTYSKQNTDLLQAPSVHTLYNVAYTSSLPVSSHAIFYKMESHLLGGWS